MGPLPRLSDFFFSINQLTKRTGFRTATPQTTCDNLKSVMEGKMNIYSFFHRIYDNNNSGEYGSCATNDKGLL